MKAYLHSVRIAPKKANIIALMVRDMRVDTALTALSRTNKKGARLIQTLLLSAIANAEHNEQQKRGNLMIKSIIVNQGTAYQRGTPMARGRMRPMNKFMSHIEIILGIAEGVHAEKADRKAAAKAKKSPAKASQSKKNTVKDAGSSSPAKKETPESSSSSAS